MSVVSPGTRCSGFINAGGKVEQVTFTAPLSTGSFPLTVAGQQVTGLWDMTQDTVAFTIGGPSVNTWTEFHGYVFNNEPPDPGEPWNPFEPFAMAGSYERFVSIPEIHEPGVDPVPPTVLSVEKGGWYSEFEWVIQ